MAVSGGAPQPEGNLTVQALAKGTGDGTSLTSACALAPELPVIS